MGSRLLLALVAGLAPVAPAVADTVVYREGEANVFHPTGYAGTSDTTLLDNSDSNREANFGAHDKILAGAHNRRRRALLRFDLSGLRDQYSTITSATLTLTVEESLNAGTLNVHQLVDANAGWVEGLGGASGGVTTASANEATWDHLAHDHTDWVGGAGIGAGGFVADPLDSVDFQAQPAKSVTPAVLTVTLPVSLIEAWITGANAGLLLRHASDGGSVRELLQLRSSEWDDVSSRPTLTIEFEPVPEPASLSLALLGLAAIARRPARL